MPRPPRAFRKRSRYITDGQKLARDSGRAFADRVLYAATPTVIDLATQEIRAKAVAIETQGVQSIATAPFECKRLPR